MEFKSRPHRDDNPLSDLFNRVDSGHLIFSRKLSKLIFGGLILGSFTFGFTDILVADFGAHTQATKRVNETDCRPYQQCMRDIFYMLKAENSDRTSRDAMIILAGFTGGILGLHITQRLSD